MPASSPDRSPGASGSNPSTTFETGGSSSASSESVDERPTGLLTGLALVLAAGLTAGTMAFAWQLAGAPDTVGLVLVTGLAFVIAVAGMLPMRWGWYVVPGVAGAHYALNFYNLIFTEGSVYGFVPGSAYGYALLTPGVGVILGFLLQGLYKLIMEI